MIIKNEQIDDIIQRFYDLKIFDVTYKLRNRRNRHLWPEIDESLNEIVKIQNDLKEMFYPACKETLEEILERIKDVDAKRKN